MLFNSFNKNKGFTLIELLIVIAIIGILSSMVIVSLGDTTSSAEEAAAKQEASQTRTIVALNMSRGNAPCDSGYWDGGNFLKNGFEDILNGLGDDAVCISKGNGFKAKWVVFYILGDKYFCVGDKGSVVELKGNKLGSSIGKRVNRTYLLRNGGTPKSWQANVEECTELPNRTAPSHAQNALYIDGLHLMAR